MSSENIAISVKNIGKCFEIYQHPKDRLKDIINQKLNFIPGVKKQKFHTEFWALQDVSFEIEAGKSVGIIGQNGSGKSTLLQIIAGTMVPTTGNVSVNGTVAALLELGSGFNPEFTGRENVYLNGCLLGLNRKEIDDKFDWIAAFADIGEHIEQSVKTYSSGMVLRLAFAVQAAIEPKILIVDEALAVGDARFQLKCFKRLETLKSNGTTILFVSHSTDLVRSFCDQGLLLNHGKSIYWGDAKVATTKYYDILFPEQIGEKTIEKSTAIMTENIELNQNASQEFPGYRLDLTLDNLSGDKFGIGGGELVSASFLGLDRPNILVGGRTLKVICVFSWQREFVKSVIEREEHEKNITLAIALADQQGKYVFGANGFDKSIFIDFENKESSTVEFVFVVPSLAAGNYFPTIAISVGNQKHHTHLQWYDCALQLQVHEGLKPVLGLFSINYEMKECVV